jgi:hypothetical protein
VQEAAGDRIEPLLSHLAADNEPAVRRFLLETVTRFQEMNDDPDAVLGDPVAPGPGGL